MPCVFNIPYLNTISILEATRVTQLTASLITQLKYYIRGVESLVESSIPKVLLHS